MIDLVERLRVRAQSEDGYWPPILAEQAADEIESLNALLNDAKQTISKQCDEIEQLQAEIREGNSFRSVWLDQGKNQDKDLRQIVESSDFPAAIREIERLRGLHLERTKLTDKAFTERDALQARVDKLETAIRMAHAAYLVDDDEPALETMADILEGALEQSND